MPTFEDLKNIFNEREPDETEEIRGLWTDLIKWAKATIVLALNQAGGGSYANIENLDDFREKIEKEASITVRKCVDKIAKLRNNIENDEGDIEGPEVFDIFISEIFSQLKLILSDD